MGIYNHFMNLHFISEFRVQCCLYPFKKNEDPRLVDPLTSKKAIEKVSNTQIRTKAVLLGNLNQSCGDNFSKAFLHVRG